VVDKNKETGERTDIIATLFQALGVAIVNLDESPIALGGLQLRNCFDTTAGLTEKVVKHYKQQAISQLLKVLGSLNIIGN
jgi:hypothetical protein